MDFEWCVLGEYVQAASFAYLATSLLLARRSGPCGPALKNRLKRGLSPQTLWGMLLLNALRLPGAAQCSRWNEAGPTCDWVTFACVLIALLAALPLATSHRPFGSEVLYRVAPKLSPAGLALQFGSFGVLILLCVVMGGMCPSYAPHRQLERELASFWLP